MGRKRTPFQITPPSWRKQRFRSGYEFFNYPSALARDAWLHVRSIGRTRQVPGFEYGHRNRDGFILHFVIRGALEHRIHGKPHTASSNQACLFGLGDAKYQNRSRAPVEFYWLWFNGKPMPTLMEGLQADLDPVFPVPDPAALVSLFRDLMRLTAAQPVACEARASAILTLILAELFKVRQPDPTSPAVPGKPRSLSLPVRRALDWISRAYDHEEASVKQLAAVVGVSLYHFSRMFRREVGMPPMKYLTWYRIERAKQWLETSTQPIHEISRRVGYLNGNYFIRAFRQTTGSAPEAYRRESRRKPPGQPARGR